MSIVTIDKELFHNIWNNGIICFDTCSMCRMYEWEYNEALKIKDAISYIYTNGCIWETEYNCQEFNEQRNKIKNSIFNQKYEQGIFKHLKKRPIPWSKIDTALKRWEGKGYSDKFIYELNKLKPKKQVSEEKINELRTLAYGLFKYPNADELFDAIVCESDITLSDEEKSKLIQRYESGEVCPGSCDRDKKNGKKYNDLFIWALVKKKSIKTEKDIIFVTSDKKLDWFLQGRPREDYIEEFQCETSRNIIILTLSDFWEHCRLYIDLDIEDIILQSNIKEQIEEKYDDCTEEEICSKVQEILYESNAVEDILQGSVKCCVDTAQLDQIEKCVVNEIYPHSYKRADEEVCLTIEMTVEAAIIAQNYTCGEEWSPGSDYITFKAIVIGGIPVKWLSKDTSRIVLEDFVNVYEIEELIPDEAYSLIHTDNYYDNQAPNESLF